MEPEQPQAPQDAPTEPVEAPAEPEAQDEGYTPSRRWTWLREEVQWQADVLGKPFAELVKRQMSAAGVTSPGELTALDLTEVVFPMRAVVIATLQKQNRRDEAEVYGSHGPEDIGPIETMTGKAQS